MTRYRTIVADPPWDHSDGTGVNVPTGKITGLPYSSMTLAEIAALPVPEALLPVRDYEKGGSLIFDRRTAHSIAAAEKTMVRRPVSGHNTDSDGQCRIKAGRRYPVEYAVHRRVTEFDREVREIERIAWFVVTNVRRERLGDITPADAAAEGFHRKGFGQPQAFLDDWKDRYPKRSDPDLEIWAITFEAESDMPLYLVAGVIGPPHGDYTNDPARAGDDGEVIDPATLSRFAAEAKKADDLREQRRRDEWDIMDEYRRAKADADALGLDTSHHDRVIKDRIARIRRGVNGKAA